MSDNEKENHLLPDEYKVKLLLSEVERLKKQVSKMHRRAQKAEGIVQATLFELDLWARGYAIPDAYSGAPTYLLKMILDDLRRSLLGRPRTTH